MRSHIFFCSLVIIVIALIIGCSGANTDVTVPGTGSNSIPDVRSGTLCLGAWQIAINKATSQVDVYQARGSDYSLNVLTFLEPPPLGNLTIDFNTLKIADPLIDVDVILTHPIPDQVFTGFDVRGVVFGPDVLNADGYTPYMNPDDFTGVPFGYQDGLLGAPDSFANYPDTLNGYKYFADTLGKDADLWDFFSDENNLLKRGKFSALTKNTRHYTLSWSTSPVSFFIFNYAIYASYNWPNGEPPVELDDFDVSTSNCQEAFCFTATVTENNLYYDGSEGGGDLSLDVELWDWMGFASYDVSIESDDIFGPTPVSYDSTSPGSTSKSQVFSFNNVDGAPTSLDDIKLQVTATDNSATFGSTWFLGLMPESHPLYNDPVYAVWFMDIPVSEESPISYTVELDMPYTINSSLLDFTPGIISRDSDDRITLGYMKHYSGTNNSNDYLQSDNYGVSWTDPPYSSWGGGPSRPFLGAMALDAEGSAYMMVNCTTSTTWSILVEFKQQPPTNSGIYVLPFSHGNGLIFSHDGYAIPFTDPSGSIQYKRSLAANAPLWDDYWLCWNTIPAETAVTSPAMLSHTRNTILTNSNDVYVIYFSSGTDTWIKTAHTTDMVTPGTWTINDVYNGSSDGYTQLRDPSIQYESDGDFHAAFIAYDSTPARYVLYTRSTDGDNWTAPTIAYKVPGAPLFDDPTVDVAEVDGHEIVLITYMEDNDIYMVFSWDEGETWQAPVLLSNGMATYPDTCTTTNGQVHTVWEHQVGSDIQIDYIRATFVED